MPHWYGWELPFLANGSAFGRKLTIWLTPETGLKADFAMFKERHSLNLDDVPGADEHSANRKRGGDSMERQYRIVPGTRAPSSRVSLRRLRRRTGCAR